MEQQALAPEEAYRAAIAALTYDQQLELYYDWRYRARPKQLAPAGDWLTWIIRAGRGFGKTRSAMSWAQERALEQPRWIALVAKTPADARDFMVEGPGGFLDKRGRNIAPKDRPLYEPSKRRLTWKNGSWATIFSDEEPDQLRGFSGDTAWIDEIGKFKNPREVIDNLAFGMRERSVDQPRKVLTLTPSVIGRANQVIRELEKAKGTVAVRGSSYENRANLDATWFRDTISVYEGTAKGREEIYGELLDPEEGGIVKRSAFKLWPARQPLPVFDYVIVSLDTAFTERTHDKQTFDPDPTACVVLGLFRISGRPELREKIKHGVMVLDCWQDHLGFPQLVERCRKEMKVAYGAADAPLIAPMYGPPLGRGEGRRPDLLLIEDKGSGISLRQTLAAENVLAAPYNPGNASKLQRLHMVSHVFHHGFVWLVESENQLGKPKTWTEPLVEQLCTFRGEGSLAHDDFVDAMTQALLVMLRMHLVSVTEDVEDRDPHALTELERAGPWGRPLIRPQNPYAA